MLFFLLFCLNLSFNCLRGMKESTSTVKPHLQKDFKILSSRELYRIFRDKKKQNVYDKDLNKEIDYYIKDKDYKNYRALFIQQKRLEYPKIVCNTWQEKMKESEKAQLSEKLSSGDFYFADKDDYFVFNKDNYIHASADFVQKDADKMGDAKIFITEEEGNLTNINVPTGLIEFHFTSENTGSELNKYDTTSDAYKKTLNFITGVQNVEQNIELEAPLKSIVQCVSLESPGKYFIKISFIANCHGTATQKIDPRYFYMVLATRYFKDNKEKGVIGKKIYKEGSGFFIPKGFDKKRVWSREVDLHPLKNKISKESCRVKGSFNNFILENFVIPNLFETQKEVIVEKAQY